MNGEQDKKKITIKPPEGATLVEEPKIQKIKVLPPKDAVILTDEKKKENGIISEASLKESIFGPPSILTEKELASSTRVNTHPLLDPTEIVEVPPLSEEEFQDIVSKKKVKDYTSINDYLTDKKAFKKELGLSDDININRELREGEQELFDVRLESSDTYQARKRVNESYFWGTVRAINYGTASFFRTLDNATKLFENVTGYSGREGWFEDIANTIEEKAAVLPDVPDTRIGRLLRNVGGLEGLFLELSITPGFKWGKIAVPKLLTQMTGSGFVNRYAEELDKSPESTKKFIEGVKGAGGGAKDAIILIFLMYGSGKVAQSLLKSTGMPIVATTSRMGTTSVGFGGANATEQLIVKGDIDWREVEGAFDIGLVFGIKDVADYAMKRAVGNYLTSSPKAEKTAKEIKIDAKELRDKAADLREKSKIEKNIEEKAGMEATADAVDSIADIKIIAEEIGKKPEEFTERIEKDTELSTEAKEHYRKKIEETAAEKDPKIVKAEVIQSEIEDLKRQGEFWEKNETVGEEIKSIKIEDIESRIKEKKIEIDSILKEPALGEPSYEFKGKNISKEEAKKTIEETKKIEDLESLKIINDPELDKLLTDLIKFEKLEKPEVKEEKIPEEKPKIKEEPKYAVTEREKPEGYKPEYRRISEEREKGRPSGRYSIRLRKETRGEVTKETKQEKEKKDFIRDYIDYILEPMPERSYFGREDLGLSKKEILASIKNIKEGKETKQARKLIIKLEDFYDQGFVEMIRGAGIEIAKARERISIDQVKELIEKAKTEISSKDELILEEITEPLKDRIEKEGITLENIDQLKEQETKIMKDVFEFEEVEIKNTENDYKLIKEYLEDVKKERKQKEEKVPEPIPREKLLIEEGERLEEKPEERIKVKKEEAKAKIATGVEDLMVSQGLIKLAEGKVRPDAVRALRNITEGVYDLGIANVEELILKVKKLMADKIKDEDQRKRVFDFIDDNRDEIGKIYDEKSKKIIKEEKVDKKEDAVKVSDDVSFALDVGSKTKDFIQKWFTSKGVFPEWLFERKMEMQANINAVLTKVGYTVKDFKKAVRKHYGINKLTGKIKITEEDIEKFNKVLKGEVPYSELPTERIAEILGEFRNQVRELSLRFMNEGLVEGDLLAKFGKDLDIYLTRSYEIHDNPKWKGKVPDKIKNDAIRYLRKKKRYRDKSDAEMKGIINEWLDSKDSPFNIISGAKLGSKDLGILMKRKVIAPEIRALLGEYKDPLMNYAKSVVRMINHIERSHFLEDVKERGMNNVFFEKPTETHYRKIAAEGTKTMFPLNGLYTTKVIAEAFEMFGKTDPSPWYVRNYMKINGLVKYSKTVGSIMTHIRNFFANPGFAVMNAHWRLGKFVPAIQATFTHLAKLDNKKWREKYLQYVKEGIVQQSVRGGEIQDIMKDALKVQGNYDKLTDNRLTNVLRKGIKFLERIYMAEDDVWKIYSRENEYARYKNAYPELSEAEVVKKYAVKITKNVTPTYSMVPEFFKKLRRFPLVGTFVSFPAEVFRTMYNTIELTHNELINPKTVKIGTERLAGLITGATMAAGLAAFSRYIYHVDDDQYADAKRFLPPWSRNSDLLILSEPKNGIIYYIDMGYCDPHNYLKNPVNALIMGDDPMGEKGIDALRELAEPFLSEELLASKLIDLSRNKQKASGAPIYNEQDTWGNQMADKVEYLMKAMEPGTLSNFRKIFKGIHGTIDETYGKKYDPVTEIIALFSGQRVAKIDAGDSFSYKAYAFEKNYIDAKRIYNRVAYRRTPPSTKSQESRALRNANRAMEELVNEISKDYHAAMGVGVKEKDLIAVLKRNRGISNRLIVDIARGEYMKWIPPEKIAYK